MKDAPVHRFRSLDALRGLAALIVVVHHLMLALPDWLRDDLRSIDLPLLFGGRFAVMLFFVLSGFVLALPYFAGKNLRYGPYLVRRFCRLYPPFAFAVSISALLCWLLGGSPLPMFSSWANEPWSSSITPGVVISHLLMTGVHWQRSIGLDSPIWSLIIEMRVSLIFPLLVLYIRRFGWVGIVGALVAAFVCAKAQWVLEGTSGASTYVAESLVGALLLTGRYVFMFLLGVILAARLEQIKKVLLLISPKGHTVIFIGGILIWMVLAYSKAEGQHRGPVDVFSGTFTMYLIVLCVAFPKVSHWLSNRIGLWLGDISYSLYLIHIPVMLTVFYLLNGSMSLGAMVAVAFGAMLICGHLMHYLIERPSMNLGRKLAGSIR